MFPKLLLPLTSALFVALSASTAETYDRVIYGGIAGAVAAAILALDANIPVQAVPYAALRARLLADGQVLETPAKSPAPNAK